MELNIIIQNVLIVLVCTISFFKASGQIIKRVDDLKEEVGRVCDVIKELADKVAHVEHNYVTEETCKALRDSLKQSEKQG